MDIISQNSMLMVMPLKNWKFCPYELNLENNENEGCFLYPGNLCVALHNETVYQNIYLVLKGKNFCAFKRGVHSAVFTYHDSFFELKNLPIVQTFHITLFLRVTLIGQIFVVFANFAQIREIKSSRNIWKALFRENKSSRNFSSKIFLFSLLHSF